MPDAIMSSQLLHHGMGHDRRRVMDGLAALTVLALLTPPACRKQALYLSELGREA
jgi:hypothetical protein